VGIYAIKPRFQELLSPVSNLCISHKIHPNTINLFGLLISLIMALSFFMGDKNEMLYLILPMGAFLRTASNALDGMVARGLKLSSRVGDVYNEFIDRVSDMAIFLSVALSGHGRVELGMIAISLVLLSSYLGILGKASGGSRVFAGILGKADRMILIGVMGILSFYKFDYWDIFYSIVIVGALITIVQRFMIIKKELTDELN